MSSARYIRRVRKGRGFAYYRGDDLVTDGRDLERIGSLAIPPAWQDVRIAVSSRARVQASGYDQAGRKQYVYSSAWCARQEAAKYERLAVFAEHLPSLRRQVEKDLSRRGLSFEKVLALVVRVMDEAYLRVGNDVYARNNRSYGVTTLRSKHAEVSGDTVKLDFTGKSGQQQHKVITDRRVARLIRQLDDLPGYRVFKYYDDEGRLRPVTSDDVNGYIKQHMGEQFSAKDFRTWGGTVLAAAWLCAEPVPSSQDARKKAVAACVRYVARRLGNTPAVARNSYIDPRLIEAFLSGDFSLSEVSLEGVRGAKTWLDRDEYRLLGLLRASPHPFRS